MSTIKIVNSNKELAEIYRFRYEVYCKEMDRTQKYADHQNWTIKEPLDDHSINIGLWLNDRIIGCMRLTFGQCESGAKYEELYRVPEAQLKTDDFAYVTKLMVLQSYRKTSFPLKLLKFGFDQLHKSGVSHTYIDCNDHLVPFFQKLGLQQYMPKVHHEEFGWVNPMVLNHAQPGRIATV